MNVLSLIGTIADLPGVDTRRLKSRTSFWRRDGTRFCKIERDRGDWVIVFTDLRFADGKRMLPFSEPDRDKRLMLRLTNPDRFEFALRFAEERSRG